MYRIFLDTRDRKSLEIKLEKDGEVIFDESGNFDLVVKLSEVLAQFELTPEDIAEIIPADGSGSFTGLKLGFTVANIFEWASGKKKVEDLKMPDYGAEPFITPPKKFKL
jgi:hypothetical protein